MLGSSILGTLYFFTPGFVDVSEVSNNDKLTLGVFMDLSNAFDTIDHNILLDKLYHYGFRGISHAWFPDSLSNRKQFIYNNINNTTSSNEKVMCCTPKVNTWPTIIYFIYEWHL